jgi:hypothetical protein
MLYPPAPLKPLFIADIPRRVTILDFLKVAEPGLIDHLSPADITERTARAAKHCQETGRINPGGEMPLLPADSWFQAFPIQGD